MYNKKELGLGRKEGRYGLCAEKRPSFLQLTGQIWLNNQSIAQSSDQPMSTLVRLQRLSYYFVEDYPVYPEILLFPVLPEMICGKRPMGMSLWIGND